MTKTGRCLCGDISYEFDGDPIAAVVCHCEHCQRQSGAAFSLNLIATAPQLTVSGELTTYEDRGELDDAVHVERRFCGRCGSPIVSAMRDPEGVIAVKVGTLDDTSWVQPVAQAWCLHKQSWVDLPGLMAMDKEEPSA